MTTAGRRIACAVLWACAALSPEAGAAPPETLRFAAPWPPGSRGRAELEAGAREIARKTAGRVRVDVAEQADLDTGPVPCAGGLLAGPALVRRSPAARIYSLPRLFRSEAEAALGRARLEAPVVAELAAEGLAAEGLVDLGWAHLCSRTPVATVAQWKAARLWVPADEPEARRAAEAYGVAPVPLDGAQVKAALRDGTVDAAVAPPLGAILLQWHVEIGGVSSEPFLALCGALALRPEALDGLAEEDRKTVRAELARAVAAAAGEWRAKEAEALAVLVQSGAAAYPFGADPGGRAEWDAWAAAAADRLAGTGWLPAERLEEVRRALEDFRAEPGKGPT